jgi:2-methylisocitrate lyase-like PEP mutase family enzyme
MRTVEDQAARIAAARAAADTAEVPMFINARTDLFLQAAPAAHDTTLLEQALQRARAYAAAGADGMFVPGLVDEALIARLVEASPLPVNIMVLPAAPPLARLAALGVARVSHGPGPYLAAMQALAAAATEATRH